jgi:ribosomal protein S15P/S13E
MSESVAPGTRHHTLLNSNEPPDESELTFARSVASKVDASLEYLDHKIANLREHLKRRKEDRASLLSYRMRNKAISSASEDAPRTASRNIFVDFALDQRSFGRGQI